MDNPFERALKGFKTETNASLSPVQKSKPADIQEQPPEALVIVNKQELMNPFELTRKLFDFAEENGIGNSGLRYADSNNEFTDNPYAKELPQKFYPIIADYPGKYWVVAFEDRFDPYYAKGTNMRLIKLSTVPKRSQGDDRIREIKISEPAPSEGLGNVQFMFVKDSVMNQAFTTINTAPEDQADSPHGSAELVYEFDPAGAKKLVSSEFNRMDEGIFEWNSSKTPVRWLRYLQMRQNKTKDTEVEYEDRYILGRHHQSKDKKDKRVQVRITATGELDDPKKILISIGLEIGSKGEVLFAEANNTIQVTLHDNDPWTNKEEILEFLKQDPNYSFLFNVGADRDKIIELLRQKASMITNDWDKPSPVFIKRLEDTKPTLDE